MLYIYSQSGVRMKQCKICYSTILPEDYVEWVITQENHKYILGKYKWVACDYCFACINIAKSSLWSLYLNTLLNIDCHNALTQILENPLPVYITEHLCLFDKPIKALYYHKQMYSAKLNTGLTAGEKCIKCINAFLLHLYIIYTVRRAQPLRPFYMF